MASKMVLQEDTSTIESSAAMAIVSSTGAASTIPMVMRNRSKLAQNEALVDIQKHLSSSVPTAVRRLTQSAEQLFHFQVQSNLFIAANAAIPWPEHFLSWFTWPQFTRLLLEVSSHKLPLNPRILSLWCDVLLASACVPQIEQNVADVFVWFAGSTHGLLLAIRGWSSVFVADIWDYVSLPLALHDYSLIPIAVWILTCTALMPLLVCLLVMWQPSSLYDSASHSWFPSEAVVHDSTLSALLTRSTASWLRWITIGVSLVIQTASWIVDPSMACSTTSSVLLHVCTADPRCGSCRLDHNSTCRRGC